MAEQVFAHGGTIDKYLGDGFMATFGTPHKGEHDAANALACARGILGRRRQTPAGSLDDLRSATAGGFCNRRSGCLDRVVLTGGKQQKATATNTGDYDEYGNS